MGHPRNLIFTKVVTVEVRKTETLRSLKGKSEMVVYTLIYDMLPVQKIHTHTHVCT